MKYLKYIIPSLLLMALPVLAAPQYRIERTLLPETDSYYELGTTTKAWLRGFFDTICLGGDCQSAWPTGGGSNDWTYLTNYNTINLTPTSTMPIWAQGGINASSTSNFVYASSTSLTTSGSAYFATAGGNVGIGTTTPWGKLAINNYSAGANTAPLFVVSSSTGALATSTAFIINSVGNVGIGTTSPWAKLSVTGSGTGTGLAFAIADSANSPKVSVLDNGNVGIGTTGPETKLYVSGDDSGAVGYYVENVNAGASASTRRIGVGVGGATAFGVSNWVNSAYIEGQTTNGLYLGFALSSGSLRFGSSDRATKMILTNAGNVGIGTTSPGSKLSVYGTSGVQILSGNSADYTSLALGRTANEAYIGIAGAANQWSQGSVAGDLNIRTQGSAQRILFNTNAGMGTTDMTINNGNVGIGTTSPQSKLEVYNGSIMTTSGGSAANLFVDASNAALAQIGSSGDIGSYASKFNVRTTGSIPITFTTGGTLGSESDTGNERVRITSDGNVGIGTTNPSYGLELYSKNLGITSSYMNVWGVGYGYQLSAYSNGTVRGALRSDNSITSGTKIGLQIGADSEYSAIIMRTAGDVLFQQTGNVGIGTTTPVNKLTVAGGLGFFGTIPTLSSCGTSPAITKGSTDMAGEVTVGSSATGCTITFAVAKTNTPFCTVTNKSGIVFTYAVSTTAITLTNTGDLSSTNIVFQCVQNNF